MSTIPQPVYPPEPYAASHVEPGPVLFGGLRVGVLSEDGVFRRTVRAGHLLRRPLLAVAVSVAVLAELARRGCRVLLFELDGGQQLAATLQEFLGPPSFPVDRGGHGQQRAVALAAMMELDDVRRAKEALRRAEDEVFADMAREALDERHQVGQGLLFAMLTATS